MWKNLLAAAMYINASWYSIDSLKQEGTYAYSKGVMANGEKYQDEALTCAANLYPLGSWLKVEAGQVSVVVQVTDRIGQRFAHSRIDLSKRAFRMLAPLRIGILRVKVTQLKGEPNARYK